MAEQHESHAHILRMTLLACLQDQSIIIGGDNRFLNGSTLVNGLQTAREFDFDLQEITFAQNVSTPRWWAPKLKSRT